MIIAIGNYIGRQKAGSSPVVTPSFEFTIKTDNLSTGSTANNQFKLPLISSGAIDFVVDWGDGTSDNITTYNQAEVTHTYPSIGTYDVKIVGIVKGWQFNNSGDRLKLLNVSKCSGLEIGLVSGVFFACSNMTWTATDAPIISGQNLSSCFASCLKFNGDVSSWDVSNVTGMSSMFRTAVLFNKDISNWNTSNVTNMSRMFDTTTAFNQNIGNWNVSNVTNFTSFMAGKTSANYSASNLDAIYNGWSSRPVKPNISISFGSIKYTSAGQAGKDILLGSPNTWTIVDGGI